MKRDPYPLDEPEQLRRGRLFQLKLRHNKAARDAARETLRERPDGQWQARIGGRLRGRTVVSPLRRVVEAEIEEHYNGLMVEANRRINVGR